MFKNYLKIALRNFTRAKMFSLINLSGLVIGLTVSLLMLVYVFHETGFEDFHQKRERIYRIAVEWGAENHKMKMAGSMPALAPALNASIPEVECAARVHPVYGAVLNTLDNREFTSENMFFCDPEFFDIFSIKLLQGKAEKVLRKPAEALLSAAAAQRFFGSEKVVGRVLYFKDQALQVTGIFADLPVNTHLKCEVLVSRSTLETLGQKVAQPWNTWG